MPIKTLLAILEAPERATAVLNAATLLAQRHGAHLLGLHVIESLFLYPGFAMGSAGMVLSSFDVAERDESAALEAAFQQQTAGAQFPCEWRAVRRGADPIGARAVEIGHAADLIVVAQPADDIGRSMLDNVIRRSGRPVLVVPPDFEGERLGAAVLLGWSATREATRAAFDALTFVAEGAEGTLLTVSRSATLDAQVEASAKDLAATLNRHGLAVTLVHRPTAQTDIADVLMTEAFERGADMIVCGAYGHSLAYDLVIGAVTRDLMTKSTLPVLFSK